MSSRAAVVLFLTLVLPCRSARAQAAPCDAAVATVGSDPSRYQLRDGTRCEGVFVQGVAGSSSLRIASLTASYDAFSDTSRLPLRVSWSAPAGNPVRLRGYSLKSGLHYRMETVAPLLGGTYAWRTNVLRALRMRKSDLGVVASMMMPLGDSLREVHLPVRVHQASPPTGDSAYELVLWSNTELSEVFVAVDAVNAGGQPGKVVQRSRELGYGVYPAARGVPIELPTLGARGVYRVRIGAVRRSGGTSTSSMLLYHAGP